MAKVRSACLKAIKGTLFVLIFCLLLYLIMCVLIFKQEDGTLPMHNYYDLPENTVDALFIGSSHIGMNVSTQILWDDYGIAGYKCWGSTQPIWNSYYYLKECLEYQTPRVVVVDVHGAIFSYDYADYVLQVKNTMGMRFGRNKIDAVMASAPRDSWFNLLTELPTFHTRYSELSEADFQYFPWNRHEDIGVLVNQSQDIVFPFEIIPPDATEDTEPLAEKEEKYLRFIIELCREKNVPLELIAAPYQLSEFEQRRYRAVSAVAAEYPGLRFTNFNEIYQQVGIDPSRDFLDPGHFNAEGVPKYTRAIVERVLADYALPDRRMDEGHIWNRSVAEELQPVYALSERFIGDGKQNYVDTGVQLYNNMLSTWTVLADFVVPPFGDEDRVIFGCYDETVNQYQGLLVNMDENNRVIVRFSSYEDMRSDRLQEGDRLRLAVVKTGRTVTVYLNGEPLGQHELQNLASYAGPLMIGCQRAADGSLFRFSRPQVNDLLVYDTALDASRIQSWTPRDLPMPPEKEYLTGEEAGQRLLWGLDYAFVGDGQERCIDTGLNLYAEPEKSWTLLTTLDAEVDYGDSVYFSCFLEDASDYHGILARRVDDHLNLVYGQGSQLDVPLPGSGSFRLAVVKDRNAYTVYVEGEKVLEEQSSACGAYAGPLLIGCELDASGKPYRFSGTTVYNLEIVDGLMGEADILAWNPAPRPETPRPEASPVDYRMESGFAGDGKKAYLDTGIQLYDLPDKSWWLHFILDVRGSESGTALACFAEDPGSYRGLLVRQVDASTYGLTLGADYVPVDVGTARTLVMDILKDGYHYAVYVNGELRSELDSRCGSWEGTLFVGCERTLGGEAFRFSRQKIRGLEIASELPDIHDIQTRVQRETNTLYFQK